MKKPTPAGRQFSEFAEKHDPTFRVESTEAVFTRPLPKGAQRVIVVAAQNATPVEPTWWRVLQTMARLTDAHLIVIPIRYKNPTSHWAGSQQNSEFWAPEVRPFLCNQRMKLNSNLTLLGDIKIHPTASQPLSSIDAVSLSSSGIVGHTRLQLKSIATPSSRMAKILTTTGACTVSNYTDSKAGKIGDFHHSLSAAMVELDGSRFYLRQLHYDTKTKSCTDLEKRYTVEGVQQAPRALCVDMGDTHVDFIDPAVERATFDPQGIIETLDPEFLVWHDLLDSYSCNPHHFGNPFNKLAKRLTGRDSVRAEVLRAISYVDRKTPPGTQSIVVGSNHDDMLKRWIINNEWREDPTNAEFYLETALAMVRGTKLTPIGTEYPDPFIYWLRQAGLGARVRALDPDESLVLGGIEVGMHGHRGPNGARGSIKNLRRIGVKSMIGHGHSPGIDEGCTQIGTSTRLRAEYTEGPGSWLNCHGVIHADGKRQLIIIIDGRWRL